MTNKWIQQSNETTHIKTNSEDSERATHGSYRIESDQNGQQRRRREVKHGEKDERVSRVRIEISRSGDQTVYGSWSSERGNEVASAKFEEVGGGGGETTTWEGSILAGKTKFSWEFWREKRDFFWEFWREIFRLRIDKILKVWFSEKIWKNYRKCS